MPDPVEFEKQFKFYEAGQEYLKAAESAEELSEKTSLLFQAARCFENSEVWRMSFHSWKLCSFSLIENIPKELFENISRNPKSLYDMPLSKRFLPYNITDRKWENPEYRIYEKYLNRELSEEEKNLHRLAWTFDFAAQTCSRNGDHSHAQKYYRSAAEAWLDCHFFPRNKLVAAKFYFYSICERISGTGNQNITSSIRPLFNDLKKIVKITIDDPEFEKIGEKFYPIDEYLALSLYFRSLRIFASNSNIIDFSDLCAYYENLSLRRYYKKEGKTVKRIWNYILYLTTANGTKYERLIISTGILSVLFFPALYSICSLFNNHCIQNNNNVPIKNFFNLIYFSIVTLTTLGYGDYHPVGFSKCISIIEAMLGYVLLGLFVWLLTRKLR